MANGAHTDSASPVFASPLVSITYLLRLDAAFYLTIHEGIQWMYVIFTYS